MASVERHLHLHCTVIVQAAVHDLGQEQHVFQAWRDLSIVIVPRLPSFIRELRRKPL
jgi:hypothetical protein